MNELGDLILAGPLFSNKMVTKTDTFKLFLFNHIVVSTLNSILPG